MSNAPDVQELLRRLEVVEGADPRIRDRHGLPSHEVTKLAAITPRPLPPEDSFEGRWRVKNEARIAAERAAREQARAKAEREREEAEAERQRQYEERAPIRLAAAKELLAAEAELTRVHEELLLLEREYSVVRNRVGDLKRRAVE